MLEDLAKQKNKSLAWVIKGDCYRTLTGSVEYEGSFLHSDREYVGDRSKIQRPDQCTEASAPR